MGVLREGRTRLTSGTRPLVALTNATKSEIEGKSQLPQLQSKQLISPCAKVTLLRNVYFALYYSHAANSFSTNFLSVNDSDRATAPIIVAASFSASASVNPCDSMYFTKPLNTFS